jgi:hypothetical protein
VQADATTTQVGAWSDLPTSITLNFLYWFIVSFDGIDTLQVEMFSLNLSNGIFSAHGIVAQSDLSGLGALPTSSSNVFLAFESQTAGVGYGPAITNVWGSLGHPQY